MKITEEQLDSYIALYKREYGEELERTRALTQFHNLINLVLYMAYPEYGIEALEQIASQEYTKDATHDE
jgi:hypothetical protein